MRSERQTSADGVVALDRALQASRFAAAADSVEASCGVLQAPTHEKFDRDSQFFYMNVGRYGHGLHTLRIVRLTL